MPEVSSSAVDRVEYRAATRTLDIWYAGGARYSYFEVPEAVYAALLAAPSIGAFVNRQVKERYAFAIEPARRRFRPD